MNSFNPFGLGQLGGGMTRRDFEQPGQRRSQGRLVQPDRAVPDRGFEVPAGVRPRSRAANLPPSANDLSAYDGGPRGISPAMRAPAAQGRLVQPDRAVPDRGFEVPAGVRPAPRSQQNLSAYDGGPRAISPGLRAPASAAGIGAARPAANNPAPAPPRAAAPRAGAATMRPLGQPAAAPAPVQGQPAAATAPAAPTEKAPTGVSPAAATTSTPAATTSAPAASSAYKPVEDLGAARRAAFMDAPDTPTGMKRVRELLGSEAGIDPMELNKFSVAELEKRALERRSATSWATELSGTTKAFSEAPDVAGKLGITPRPMQFEGNPFENSTANAASFATDKSFGFDFAVPSGGSPLTREIINEASESPLLTKDGLGNWFSSYTNELLDQQYKSGEINKPVETLGKPLVIGNKNSVVNGSSYIEAFQNAGEPAPVDGKTAAVAKALAGDVIGGGRRRMSGNLGFRDLASLPPLVRGAYQAAGVRY